MMSPYFCYTEGGNVEDQVFFAQHEDVSILKFTGDIRFTLCPAVEDFLKTKFDQNSMASIVIDLTETKSIDSTALGLLAHIAIQAKQAGGPRPALLVSSDDILRVLKGMSFDVIFTILRETGLSSSVFQEIKPVDTVEQDMIKHILSAHRTLMSLSEENRTKFENVIKVLEKEVDPNVA